MNTQNLYSKIELLPEYLQSRSNGTDFIDFLVSKQNKTTSWLGYAAGADLQSAP